MPLPIRERRHLGQRPHKRSGAQEGADLFIELVQAHEHVRLLDFKVAPGDFMVVDFALQLALLRREGVAVRDEIGAAGAIGQHHRPAPAEGDVDEVPVRNELVGARDITGRAGDRNNI